MRWLVQVLVAVQCLQIALSAKILAICIVASHSHSHWCYSYMALLAKRGHQITVLGVDEPKIQVPNMETFIVEGIYKEVITQESIHEYITMAKSKRDILNGILTWITTSTETVLLSQALSNLIHKYSSEKKPFDLIIHDDGSCAGSILGLVPLFGNPPLVMATAYGSPQWMTFRAGNVFNPAYISNMLTNFKPDMDFCERFVNTLYYAATEWYTHYRFEKHQEYVKRERFGEGLPHVRDLAKRANIIMVNYHPAFDGPRPMLPGVIGIAGLHIDKPSPLPQDIQDFMDGARHGVILFSFGSNVDSAWFDTNFENKVIRALEQLPQRVIWKWDKTPAKIPPNVWIRKWLPQVDILVHPKLRLFVTHCGLLSVQEAILYKAPILALPVFIDQLDTAVLLERRNLTIQLNVNTMTSAQLRDGIKEILNKPMYKRNIEKLSELMQDAPLTAKQQAVFWTEYAIRHDGAPHLRSPAADMPWYQLLLLDVIGFAVLAVLVISWFIKRGVKDVIQVLCLKKYKCD